MCHIKAKGVKEGVSEEGISELNLEGSKGFPQVKDRTEKGSICKGLKTGYLTKCWGQKKE